MVGLSHSVSQYPFYSFNSRPVLCLRNGKHPAVRPLLNLSQTCFLSAILQSLLHNPLWKQYFLSSGHDRRVCALRRAKAVQSGEVKPHGDESQFDSNGAGANGMGCEENGPGGLGGVRLSELGLGVGECMNCEMDGAFAEVSELLNVRWS